MSTSVDPSNYSQQLSDKIDSLKQDFADLPLPDIEVFESEPLNFRMRAEFRIWHEGEESHFAMHKPGTNQVYTLDDFPIGSVLINELMPKLIDGIRGNDLLRRRLYVVEFLTTLSGDAVITMIYHKALDDQWQREAEALGQKLGFPIIGRSRKQKLVLERDYVLETLEVLGKSYHFKQVETGFTQPNAGVNQKMLGWAVTHSRDSQNDLLELYCGNGNFTIPLAQNFDRVLATEISKVSVNSAQYNLEKNQVGNVAILRMSSEEFTQALNGEREFKRLKDVNLADYQFDTVFVDPPRAGLDNDTLDLVSRFKRIIYISCNPVTLKDNLLSLVKTHDIDAFAAFDQFPYTHHLECGCILTRR